MDPRKYINRSITAKINELFNNFPVVVVSGARQVGKSTLIEHIFPHIPKIVFDPVADVENARSDPDLFLANRRPPVVLDEIQYAPELVPAIKRALEKDRRPGQFILTGSQQWGIMKMLSESLAGRAVFLDLEGFSLHEIAGNSSSPPWLAEYLHSPEDFMPARRKRLALQRTVYEQLWRGSLPETHFLPQQLISNFLLSYQRTYIERDIRQMADIADLQEFSRFFRLCAALTAQEINHSQLGREIGVTSQTAQRWLSLLKATFQWFEIPPYSGNTIKRISGKPKGHMGDTGLACAAQAISAPEAVGGHPLWGSFFESAVVGEIRKMCALIDGPPNLYHWRSHGGAEVDLILEWNGSYFPIEIKAKSRPALSDTRGIEAFRKTYPHLRIRPGMVIAPCEDFGKLRDDVLLVPWDAA